MDHVEIARAAGPRGEVVLLRREHGDALELRVNGVYVMDTAETSTERALASAALDLAEDPAQVLVGGLGLGFTAEQVLADARVQRCTVVEIEPAVVGWLRDGTVPHGPALLASDRLEVVEGDVADVLAAAPPDTYDLVLLDVDNGPGYLVHETNAALYRAPFLQQVERVTRQVLVVWSAAEAPALEAALAATFGHVGTVRLPVLLGGREEHYWLYAARSNLEA